MKKNLISFVFVLILSLGFISAQNLDNGDVSVIKGEKILNIKYEYDNLRVGDKPEESYLSEKVAEKNKKEPGKGDKWKESWFKSRTESFQPKFEELFNKFLNEKGITAGQNKTEAKYTIILKTTKIDPGFNVGVMRRPAFIDVQVIILDNTNKEIAKITQTNIPGRDAMGFDYDVSYRVSEAYAKCGKSMAKFLIKKAKL